MNPTALFILYAALFHAPCSTSDLEKNILYISGASDISEVPSNEMEQFEAMAAHPVPINTLSRTKLLSCGLFSSYQAECILDYRARCGDILSDEELSSVDGFTHTLALHLSPFLDFTPGSQMSAGWMLDAAAGGAFKYTGRDKKGKEEGGMGRYYAKVIGGLRTKAGDFGASVAARSEMSRPLSLPDQIGASISYDGRKYLTRIAAGCFNARFGQGLVQWSGITYESFTSPQALMKKPSGIAAYTSWSPDNAMMGIAARIDLSRFSLSPFADVPDRIFGGNFAWNHRNGQVGATVRYDPTGWKASVDFQQTIAGTVLFGETRI